MVSFHGYPYHQRMSLFVMVNKNGLMQNQTQSIKYHRSIHKK